MFGIKLENRAENMTGKKIKPPCDLMKEVPLREEEGYCLSHLFFLKVGN